MADASLHGTDLAAAASSSRDQVTPALPQTRAPQTQLLWHSQPAATPGPQLCRRRWAKARRPGAERPDATGLGCSPEGDGSRKPHYTGWQGGTGERAPAGSCQGWRNPLGALKQHPLAQRLFTGISLLALSPGTHTWAGLPGENTPWRGF